MLFVRETKPDGTTVASVTENGTTYTETGRLDYNRLKERILSIERTGDGISTYATEHIANCYHRTLTTNHKTVTREEAGTSAAAMAAVLATAFTSNAKIILSLAGKGYGFFANSDIAYEVVSEEVNEVFFSADNVYYTHCYHDSIERYDAFDHNVGSTTYYYQAVGG